MRNGGNEIMSCIADCILSCLEGLIRFFNKWAYVQVPRVWNPIMGVRLYVLWNCY